MKGFVAGIIFTLVSECAAGAAVIILKRGEDR